MQNAHQVITQYRKAEKAYRKLILAKARELYPHYDNMWSEDAAGYEGGAFCQEDALREAEKLLTDQYA